MQSSFRVQVDPTQLKTRVQDGYKLCVTRLTDYEYSSIWNASAAPTGDDTYMFDDGFAIMSATTEDDDHRRPHVNSIAEFINTTELATYDGQFGLEIKPDPGMDRRSVGFANKSANTARAVILKKIRHFPTYGEVAGSAPEVAAQLAGDSGSIVGISGPIEANKQAVLKVNCDAAGSNNALDTVVIWWTNKPLADSNVHLTPDLMSKFDDPSIAITLQIPIGTFGFVTYTGEGKWRW